MINTRNWIAAAVTAVVLVGEVGAWSDITFTREAPLEPGPDDGRIAVATARLLEDKHYRQMKFDDVVSSNFFNSYLTTLDPQHLHFLQSDVAEFQSFETNLDNLTEDRNVGPGFDIFQRFFERLEQRTQYAQGLLETENFVFEDTEPVQLNRKDAEFPKDLAEAKSLWRDRLRYEYLEEKLALVEQRRDAEKADVEGSDTQPGEVKTESNQPSAAVEKSIDEEVKEKLDRRYARNLKFFAEWDSDDVIQLYLSTLGHVYDPHTEYMGRAALEQFAINMNLALFGIGAQLRSVDGYCTIEKLLPGGPAIKSKKLKEKERIVAVAQGNGESVDVVEMSLQKIVQLIRGPKGTEVQLTVIPPEGEPSKERHIVKLIRDEIPLDEQAAKAQLIEIPTGDGSTNRIGVIDLPTFYAPMEIVPRKSGTHTRHSTSEDVAALIEKLKEEHIQGLILDLRRNGGGSLEEAVRLTGLFIKEGPVVQVRDFDESVDVDEDKDPKVQYDGPMIVLTSRGSASASEIVAGALQDYGRAVVVGDISTHGKGTVQSLNQLSDYFRFLRTREDPGALKITIRKFYRVNGESTQLRGVTPDIVLPAVANVLEDVGEAGLDNPLEWDNDLGSADYTPVNRVKPYLPELRKQSDERVSHSQDFEYIREDMDRMKEIQARKTVLLNETERAKELEDAKERDEVRKTERENRPEKGLVVYEITLKNLDQPGLPPPLGSTNVVGETSSSLNGTEADPMHEGLISDSEDINTDPTLEETSRILLDYISALQDLQILTAGKDKP